MSKKSKKSIPAKIISVVRISTESKPDYFNEATGIEQISPTDSDSTKAPVIGERNEDDRNGVNVGTWAGLVDKHFFGKHNIRLFGDFCVVLVILCVIYFALKANECNSFVGIGFTLLKSFIFGFFVWVVAWGLSLKRGEK